MKVGRAVASASVVVMTGAALLQPSTVAPAAADDSITVPVLGITVSVDGWIQYASKLSSLGLSGTTQILNGTRDLLGNCAFEGANSSDTSNATDDSTTLTEEVALNPLTCAMKVLTVNVSSDQAALLAPLAPSDTTSGDSTQAPVAALSSTAQGSASSSSSRVATPRKTATSVGGIENAAYAVPAAVYTYNHYLATSWIDPINITITRQTVALQWTNYWWSKWAYNRYGFGGCVSGYCLDKTYITSGSDSLTSVSGGWKKTASVNFQNNSFAGWVEFFVGPAGWAACGFPLSNTAYFHHEDDVTGYAAGGWAIHWNDSKSGACTNLVHHADASGASYPL